MSGQVIVNDVSLVLYDELFRSNAYRSGLISYIQTAAVSQANSEDERSIPSAVTNIHLSWNTKEGLNTVIDFLQKVEQQKI